MPLFFFDVDYVKGSEGQSAVCSAAYKNGVKMKDCTNGYTYNFSRKERVDCFFVMLPEYANEKFKNSEYLWNAIEKIETKPCSRKALLIKAALQKEFTYEKNMQILKEFCEHFFVKYGHIVDIAIHDMHTKNPHAHILVTLRPILENGEFGNKNRDIYKGETTAELRIFWETINNKMFDLIGKPHLHISKDSYKSRGIEKEPQKPMGPKITSLLKEKGIVLEQSVQYEIDSVTAELEETRREIAEFKKAESHILLIESAESKETTIPIGLKQVKNSQAHVFAADNSDNDSDDFAKQTLLVEQIIIEVPLVDTSIGWRIVDESGVLIESIEPILPTIMPHSKRSLDLQVGIDIHQYAADEFIQRWFASSLQRMEQEPVSQGSPSLNKTEPELPGVNSESQNSIEYIAPIYISTEDEMVFICDPAHFHTHPLPFIFTSMIERLAIYIKNKWDLRRILTWDQIFQFDLVSEQNVFALEQYYLFDKFGEHQSSQPTFDDSVFDSERHYNYDDLFDNPTLTPTIPSATLIRWLKKRDKEFSLYQYEQAVIHYGSPKDPESFVVKSAPGPSFG